MRQRQNYDEHTVHANIDNVVCVVNEFLAAEVFGTRRDIGANMVSANFSCLEVGAPSKGEDSVSPDKGFFYQSNIRVSCV